MAKADLDEHFAKVERLAQDMQIYAPISNIAAGTFRANLAGLLIVNMCSTYETCVKEIIINFAERKHAAFGAFATKNYAKLNSRINVPDLYKYAKLFDGELAEKFKENLRRKRARINQRTGKDICQSYEQILSWRHDFAHAGIHNTTIEEALKFHNLGKRVLYIMDEAFV